MPSTLIVNPRDDPAFASFVRAIEADGVDSRDDFELRLRQRYPEAVVRLRDLHGETFTIWYVYRDGHWVSGMRGPRGAEDAGV